MIIVPKKAEHRFVFVSNIKDPLADHLNPFPEYMEAFLLSQSYSTPKALDLVAKAQSLGSLIVSDNGNFSRITTIAGNFMEKGGAILAKAEQEVQTAKRVSPETLNERLQLIQEIELFIADERKKTDVNKIIHRQMQCHPDYAIGMEDLHIPVLHMIGLLDTVFEPEPVFVKPFQLNTQQIYLGEQSGQFGSKEELDKVVKFLVYHSYDYASARQAALLNKKSNAEGIAISLGAPLASRNYIPGVKIGNTQYVFSEKLPESYVLSIALVLACVKGDTQKLPVHILGVGTPILIILLGCMLRKSRAVSIDSTATFKDADDGNLYGSRYAFLKMDMFKVAAFALVNDDPYASSSPWFNWFESLYPSDWKTLRQELNVTSMDDTNALAEKLKKNPALLEKYIPFFTPMRAGADLFIKRVRIARTGTNFWVLNQICAEIRKRLDNPAALNRWVDAEIKRYEMYASPKWATTVRMCFDIIKKHL